MTRTLKNALSAVLVHATAAIALAFTPGIQARPNVVIFITDDQSEEDFGFLGGNAHTPNIDRLAKSGLVLSNFHVTSTVCSPSRYAVFTGRYAGRSTGKKFMHLHPPGTMTRVENNVELEQDRINLPKALQEAGYRTGFVGKSHIVDHATLNEPARRWEKAGLKTYARDADPRDEKINQKFKANHAWWCNRIKPYGFDEVDAVYAGNLRELYSDAANVHNLEWTVAAANGFIRRHKDRPFFLYVASTVPHGPAPWIQRKGEFPFSLDADPRMSGQGYLDAPPDAGMPTRQSVKERVQQAGLDVRLRHHPTWLDDAVGSIVKTLKSSGVYEDTLFVFMSDHGARRHGKTTLYDNGMRVPAFIHWPGGIKKPARSNALIASVDLAPTILELAGTKPYADMDGKSMANTLSDPSAPHREDVFGELGYSRAVKTERWKYIAIRYPGAVTAKIKAGAKFPGFEGEQIDRPYLVRNGHLGHHAARLNPNYFQSDQLYDLSKDPAEQVNIADQHPEVVQAMKQRLRSHLAGFDDRPFGEFTD